MEEKEMKEYIVEFTSAENNYTYTGQWCDERVEAETEEEAIEFVKDYLDEHGDDSKEYIYRSKEYTF